MWADVYHAKPKLVVVLVLDQEIADLGHLLSFLIGFGLLPLVPRALRVRSARPARSVESGPVALRPRVSLFSRLGRRRVLAAFPDTMIDATMASSTKPPASPPIIARVSSDTLARPATAQPISPTSSA